MENKRKNTQAIIIVSLMIVLVATIGGLIWFNLKQSNSLTSGNATSIQQGQQATVNRQENLEEKEPVPDNNGQSSADVSKPQTPELTQTEAKTIVEEYLNIKGSYQGSPLEMKLLNTKLNMSVDYSTATSDGYVSTNVEYKEFKELMLTYMTEEMLKTFEYYKNIDGVLYAFDGGATGISYTDVELSLVSQTEGVYEYAVKCLVAGEETNYNAVVKYVNGNYVVASCSYRASTSKTPELTQAEAKTIVEEYLNIRGSYQGSPLEMKLLETELGMKIDYSKTTSDGYVSTGIKYSTFKDLMLKYMTEDIFKTFTYYKNIDGVLYAFDGGATGRGYTDIKLKLVSKTETTYEYDFEGTGYMPEEGAKVTGKVVIEYVNDNYVISDCKIK
ncbi:MAG: hypothetical protein IJ272_06660 [Clostridia bacterium]|nr:hypothetical protein [Clostridia bacterium]